MGLARAFPRIFPKKVGASQILRRFPFKARPGVKPRFHKYEQGRLPGLAVYRTQAFGGKLIRARREPRKAPRDARRCKRSRSSRRFLMRAAAATKTSRPPSFQREPRCASFPEKAARCPPCGKGVCDHKIKVGLISGISWGRFYVRANGRIAPRKAKARRFPARNNGKTLINIYAGETHGT